MKTDHYYASAKIHIEKLSEIGNPEANYEF